ncbi:HlyD family secretion protein [Loktanella sp. SALINAS62]|uniref:HlyD family efflux transporter periplasmic adaptor subunit n=1 Tax=Loktanella sp. SALINAS62 TaxID=2706124 RepID=UPI001B8CF5B5|nr:HlyD family secretion protein [Loktanella sp. SALINAS62]MBS1302685.1 HlyD family efflux transporter periplasmic adaptor subunit [Loktanella sp. SALINAS62]
MRYTALVIGILTVILALWIMVGEQMSGASANAVVNAPVVTVRAPVAGTLRLPERQFGSRVSRGQMIASVQDTLVDRVRLYDLLMELRLEHAARLQIEETLEETQNLRQQLVDRAETFRMHRLQELETRLSHAEARLAILEDTDSPDGTVQQFPDTDGPNIVSATSRPRSLMLEDAREQVAVLEIALSAARQGVFLGDGYNDAPNSEQRVTELDSEINTLTTGVAEAQARHAAVEERISRERIRVNGLTGGEIAATVNGSFWEILEADGVTVQRGDPLVRLVDCDSALVTLSVTERVYNQLEIGQAAKFRLGGTSAVYDATISRLAGSGAETIYRNLAVAPSQRHLERFDVALIVPDLQSDTNANCMIGRTGRAFFDNRPLDWLRGIFG